MKLNMKKAIAVFMVLMILMSTAACSRSSESDTTSSDQSSSQPSTSESVEPTQTGEVSQGVTDDEILIGCTMANSGNYAFIGVPIVDTMKAVFDRINANGGINGREVRLIHYDDGYDAATGQALIEKLVEEDKVFALNALGGNNVGPSLDYIKSFGIPAVNIVSGLNSCYTENDPTSAIFPIQPASKTDGTFLMARVLHESLFGPNKDEKLPDDAMIGIFHSTAEASMTTLDGILEQAEREGIPTSRLMIENVTPATYSASIEKMKQAGVQVFINTLTNSKAIVAAMDDAGWEVPYVGYYGVSTPQSYSPDIYKEGRPIYATTWAEYSSPEAKEMLADMDDALTYNKDLSQDTLESYKNNLYARVGYVAAMTLAKGLEEMDAEQMDMTWANYIKAMEQASFEDLSAYGYYTYADGSRLGVTKLAFTEYTVVDEGGTPTGVMLSTRTYETLEEVMAK